MINLREEKIEKICIIMLGLLGDVLMRTPIVREIKKIYPHSNITVIADPIGKEVLKNNPDIDEILVMNRKKKNYLKYLYNKIDIQMKIIIKSFDLMISLYGGNSGNNVAKLSFAKYQIGIKKGNIWTNKELVKNNQELNFKNRHHITNDLFRVLKYFDIKIDELDTTPYIYSSEDSKMRVENYVKSFSTNNYYLLSLGSGGLEKICNMGLTFELIKYIYEKYNILPAVISNPGQEYLQNDLINNFLKPNNIDYIELKTLPIEDISFLIKLSKFIIVPDTGLYHIAVAHKTPIYSIFTYTNPKLVEPTQGVYKIVFKEDDTLVENKNLELKFGTNNIEFSKLTESFDEFYIKLENYC